MKKYSIFLLVFTLFITAGCDDFLNVNTDPNEATSVQGDLLFPTVIANFAEVRSIELGPANNFITQVWTSKGSGGTGVFLNPERYNIGNTPRNNIWLLVYETSLKNLKLIINDAQSNDPVRNNVAAQSKILRAYSFYVATTVFGKVPYTQALNVDKYPNPKFDDQETILRGLVGDLKEATQQINTTGNATSGVTDGDLIYKGDMHEWKKFGNSLLLRILMLIRNKDTSVDSQIDSLLQKSLIRTNSSEADFPFYTEVNNENNVWKLNNQFGGFTNAANGNSFLFAGKSLVDLLKDKNDPRLSTYFEKLVDFDTGDPVTDEYKGGESGSTELNNTSMVSQNTIRRDWPSRILTAPEVYFYEAEFRVSNSNMVAADTSFKKGVKLALDYFDGKPGEISDSAKTAYLSSLPDLTTMSSSNALQAIEEQEYIEVYDRAPENWVHWKRTKVPELQLPIGAVLGSVIRRYTYPISERSSNPNAPDPPLSNDTPMWFEK